MNSAQKRRTPAGGPGREVDQRIQLGRELYGAKARASSARLPTNWRDRLPDPASYYAQHLEALSEPDAEGWARTQCPFHDDCNRSLSVRVASTRGHWRCAATCGYGDLVAFHQRITGSTFVEAVRDLIGLRGGRSP